MQSPLNPFYSDIPSQTDSSVFRYVAQEMHAGHMPYVDTFDHKGPLLYLINYLGHLLSPTFGIWVVEFIFMLVAIYFAYRIAKRFLPRALSLIVAGTVFSLLATTFEGGNLAEEYALPLQLISMDIFLRFFLSHKDYRAQVGRQVLDWQFMVCGACFAATLLLRPNLIAIWLVCCVMILVNCLRRKAFRQLACIVLSFAIGGSIVALPIILWLVLGGAFTAFVDSYFLFNFQYSGGSVSNLDRVQTAITFISPIVVSLAFVAMIAQIYLQRQKRESLWFNIGYVILMAVALAFVSMSAREYQHYNMSMLPILVYPYCVLYGLVRNIKGQTGQPAVSILLSLYLTSAIILPAWLPLSNYALENIKNRHQPPFSNSIIEYIVTHTSADDRISVVGNQDYIYVYTDRLSASYYSYQYPIAEINPEISDRYLAELAQTQPKLIVVSADNPLGDQLWQFLQVNHYHQVSTDLPIYSK